MCFLSTLECIPFIKHYPSEIALCSILIASKLMNACDRLTDDFIRQTCYYEQNLGAKGDVIQLLNDRNTLIEELTKILKFANNHQQKAIQRKYSSQKYGN